MTFGVSIPCVYAETSGTERSVSKYLFGASANMGFILQQ